MKSSKPFDSDNLPFFKKSYRLSYWIFFFINFQLFIFNFQLDMGTTYRTGIRLGVKSPVFRIVIFSFTIRTQLKYGHGGVRPVVRNGPCDRISGSAVCTVNKGVEVSSVISVKEFPETVLTYRHIRRN